MKKTFIAIFCLFLFSGCSKAKYINELFALKRVGDEQVAMGEIVAQQDSKFDILLKDVKSGNISEYKTRESLLSAFGKPIFVKKVSRNDKIREKWLYRYSTQFFRSSKVIFYLDDMGIVEDWEYIEPK
ncbi:MAG: hypothetical protein KKD07_06675 [Candidatus Omnitrophica bacterium]|nr:hypothetical protein [Candidatus Omnitrophota bacterium]MBU1996573.1 hypothetical protein [Candidatus Omnitrophota bacterium]MBU4334107.1 hypothetical protein [Candidatus Omnitrophota bacterium]